MVIFCPLVQLYGNNYSVFGFLFIWSSRFGLMTLSWKELGLTPKIIVIIIIIIIIIVIASEEIGIGRLRFLRCGGGGNVRRPGRGRVVGRSGCGRIVWWTGSRWPGCCGWPVWRPGCCWWVVWWTSSRSER